MSAAVFTAALLLFLIVSGVIIYDDALIGEETNIGDLCAVSVHLNQSGAGIQRFQASEFFVVVHQNYIEVLQRSQCLQVFNLVVRTVDIDQRRALIKGG